MKRRLAAGGRRTGVVAAAIAGTTLLMGGALILAHDHFRQSPKFNSSVGQVLPSADELPGWQVTPAPIADTLEMQRRVLDILEYDDAGYVIYQQGDLRVSVYLAYWRPGKVSVRAVARHTPDVCWTLSGWTCETREELEAMHLPEAELGYTEYRVFTANGRREYVAFWHLAGDEVVSYHTGGRPPWHAAISEFVRWGNQFNQEQFFLRISSNQPISAFAQSEVVRKVVLKFPSLHHRSG